MKLVNVNEQKSIYGLSTRTTNANEMDPNRAQLGKLWQRFDAEVNVDYQGGERVYGVYYQYQSDANGEFNVLAGREKLDDELQEVIIPAGRYLVFSKQAITNSESARVEAVIACWGEIWHYFEDQNSEFKRAYKVDYEHYENAQDITIYISILS